MIREWFPLEISMKSKYPAAFLGLFCVRVRYRPISSRCSSQGKPLGWKSKGWILSLVLFPGCSAFPSLTLQQWKWAWRSAGKAANQKCLMGLPCHLKMVRLMLDVQALSHSHWFHGVFKGRRMWNQQEDWFSTISHKNWFSTIFPNCVMTTALLSWGRGRRMWPERQFTVKSFDEWMS